MAHQSRFAGYAGLIAAASMAVSPTQAAEVAANAPQGQATLGYATGVIAANGGKDGGNAPSTFDVRAETSDYWRRGYGWRRGWRRHRRGIRGGDILAGAIILGGIAAIASASNNNRRRDRDVVIVDRDNRRYDDRRDNRRFDDRRDVRRSSGSSGIDNAVSQCRNEIEQDVRIDGIDGASRVAEGWIVTGTLFNGSGFTCQIDNNGRISRVDYSGFASRQPGSGDDRQWSDSRYQDARAASVPQRYTPPLASAQAESTGEALPAYPGGPLPGETFSE